MRLLHPLRVRHSSRPPQISVVPLVVSSVISCDSNLVRFVVLREVCINGGAGGIGQPLSMLMAMNDSVKEARYSMQKLRKKRCKPAAPAFQVSIQDVTMAAVRCSASVIGRVQVLEACQTAFNGNLSFTPAEVPPAGVAADLGHLEYPSKASSPRAHERSQGRHAIPDNEQEGRQCRVGDARCFLGLRQL